MYCKNCGVFIQDGATACDICGQSVTSDSNATPTTPSTQNYTSSYTVNRREQLYEQSYKPQKREHPFFGTLGAIIGAILGGASIILFSQIGFIASLSGVILAFCTMKGYQLLGRRLTNRGAIISIILILITPYLADRLDWALVICESYGEYGEMLLDAFIAIPDLIAEGYIEKSVYTQNLVMIYIFAAVGAFGSLKNMFNN